MSFKKGYHYTTFTKAEDKKILSLANDQKIKNWKEIASHISGKTPKQVRDRYNGYLKCPHDDRPFTEYEDNIILQFVHENGKFWKKLARLLNKRSNNQVKNRYQILSRRMNKKSTEKQKKEETKKRVTGFENDEKKSTNKNKANASEMPSSELETTQVIDDLLKNEKLDLDDPLLFF